MNLEMTKKQAETCRLDDYRRSLADQDHLIQSTRQCIPSETQLQNVDVLVNKSEGLNVTPDNKAVRQIPILILPEESQASLLDTETRPGDLKGTGRLVLADGDSCSDASFCDYSASYRPPKISPRGRSSSRMEDDSSDDGECDDRGDDEIGYDSDLESLSSDPGKLSHAKKMRRWASLAKGRFEKMLLDCIVNTGKSWHRG